MSEELCRRLRKSVSHDAAICDEAAMLAAAPPHVVELDSLRAELTAEVFKAIDCDMPCKNIRGCTCAMEGAQAILKLLGVK